MTDLEFRQRRLRECVARDIAFNKEDYVKILDVMERIGFFSNWTMWEITNRPVNLSEIEEIVFAEMYRDE